MIYSAILANDAYTAPREDALAFDEEARVFVATDGVTRDYDAVRHGHCPYPDPSVAQAAADASATAILGCLLGRNDAAPEERAREALEAANQCVAAVNERVGLFGSCDYLERDLAGAVAAAALVNGSTMAVGWIGDCGVALLRDGEVVFQTRDQLDNLMAYLKERPATYNDDRRVFIRRDLRNKPDFRPDGREVTYGVLTGEPGAIAYIETATVPVRPGDVVATYTDGFHPYFKDSAFREALCGDPDRWDTAVTEMARRYAMERPKTHGGERSLLLYRIPD